MAAKTISFLAVKAAFHSDDLARIARSTFVSGALKLTLGFSAHYALLKSDLIPQEISWLAAYGLPGMASTALRYGMDYKSGVLR